MRKSAKTGIAVYPRGKADPLRYGCNRRNPPFSCIGVSCGREYTRCPRGNAQFENATASRVLRNALIVKDSAGNDRRGFGGKLIAGRGVGERGRAIRVLGRRLPPIVGAGRQWRLGNVCALGSRSETTCRIIRT